MGIGRYMARELIREIGNRSREFFEFVLPPMDIVEDGNELVILADMAGFAKDEIGVRISDNILTISATREPFEHAGSSYWQQRPLRIEKKVPLPIKVKEEGEEAIAKATYKQGVLEIRIPITGVSEIKID